jgi:hypothetical protein
MKCCICGTVRDCGKYLDNIFSIMEKIGTLFEDYRIILYYDLSTDNTLEKLHNYSKKNNKLVLLINTEPLLKYRTHRIALGRNKCLKTMRQQFDNYDHFIMIDCDDKCDYTIKLNLLKNYLLRNDWDSLSFNHPAGYYDLWALSKRPFVVSCHHFKVSNRSQNYITNIIKKTPRHKLIRCLSAFNGFSIYRTNKFKDCWYDGHFRLDYIPAKLIKENVLNSGKIIFKSDNEINQDCEHRFFHFSAVKKHDAKIMISPHCLFV